jgi:hypothetical protein
VPLRATLRQSAVHQSLLPFAELYLDVLKFQILFECQATSAKRQSRATLGLRIETIPERILNESST